MSYHHRRKRRMSEMNVVPYIDVMLVLLIIFMITSPLLTEGVKVELPKTHVGTDPLTAEKGVIIINVKANGEIFLQNEDYAVSADMLIDRVRTLAKMNNDTQVFVKGDTNAVYGEVVDVMASLKKAGIQKVSLVTQGVGKRK
ncbi:MAG: protein TolR [Beggiatoa sp. IS2]|nr:MAG: protein TolR [Beggiatoa sp. IS2]